MEVKNMQNMKFLLCALAVAAVSFCHAGLVAECYGRKAFILGEKNVSLQVKKGEILSILGEMAAEKQHL